MPGVLEQGFVTTTPAQPGENLFKDYQIELWKDENTILLMGAGTDYHLTEARGLDKVNVVSSDFDKQADHGSYIVTPERMPGRQINLQIVIKSSNIQSLAPKLDTLVRFFNPVDTPTICTIFWPGRPLLRTDVYPREIRWNDSSQDVQGGAKVITGEIYAPDPLWYSNTVASSVMTIASPGTTTTTTITNSGNIHVDSILTFVGPATNLSLTNNRVSRAIKMNYDLLSSDTLVVDTQLKSVKLNGARRNDLLRTDSQWWKLEPGDNSLTYTRGNTNGSTTATIEHRNGWSGV